MGNGGPGGLSVAVLVAGAVALGGCGDDEYEYVPPSTGSQQADRLIAEATISDYCAESAGAIAEGPTALQTDAAFDRIDAITRNRGEELTRAKVNDLLTLCTSDAVRDLIQVVEAERR